MSDRPLESDDVEWADRRIRDHPVLGALPEAPSVAFTFDGRQVIGRHGEPIAAALLASGIRIFRTMPRSGDPRGGWCMVGRCGDCLVVVDGLPNVRACVTPVANGLSVETQVGLGERGAETCWPEDPAGETP